MSVAKEREFGLLFDQSKVVYSNAHQDMKEHWDVQVDGVKFDVKAMKRISRSDSSPTNLYNFLELKNVRGNPGWLYGKADAVAFETENKWILVKLKDLQELAATKVQKIYVKKSKDSLYKLYRRFERLDLVTMVHSMDLVEISYDIICKK